ncbi:hypothetical protein JYB64_20010, partial [Algoriphagus aestuarii]|nr:hypothetical protein [Algoriphagus aestuarii]
MKNFYKPTAFVMMSLTFLLYLGNAFSVIAQSGTATVSTDKDDYSPGMYVIITGSGWQPGETVTLHIDEDPKPNTCMLPHDMTAVADPSGKIYNDQMLIKENHLGVTFTLTAEGESSGYTATWIFTDAGLSDVVVTGTSFCPGNSVTIDFNSVSAGAGGAFKNGNIFTAQLSNSLGNFSSPVSIGSISFNGGGSSNSHTIIGTIPSIISAGTGYRIRVVSSDPVTNSPINQTDLTINGSTTIDSSPTNSNNFYGSNASFSVTATGAITYQWEEFNGSWTPLVNGGIYSGVNTSTLTLTKPSVNLSGRKYRVVVTGDCGSVTSDGNATLTVNKKALTAASSVAPKVYDGSPVTGTVSLGTVLGLIGTETLDITPSAADYADANAGIGKATTISYSLADGTNGGLAANYSMADFATTGDITKAPTVTTITINGGPFSYTGSAIEPATVSVTGAGGLNLSPTAVYLNNTNTGTATASYDYAESANHLSSSDSKTFEIGKANATIDVTGYSGVYDGSAHGATGTAEGVLGEALAGLDLGASYTNVPGGTADWTFTDETGNYNDASGSVDIILTKAPTVTTVTINGGPFTYTGSAITPATVSVTGAGGLNLSPTAVYLNNTNAGTATASYDYAESVNHLSSSDSKTFEIGKANATIDVTGYSGVYDGSAHGATGTAEGVLGEALAGLDLGASFINVPGGTAYWTFTDETGNYNDASGSVDIILTKAPTVTTVTINGGPFTYTGSAIEPATVSVTGAGGLNLTPTADYANNVNAGTATASYSYAESANHLSSSDSKTFEIGKANATIDVTGYSGVYDGSAHGATGTAEGVLGEALAGLDLGASFTDVPGGTADWTFTDETGNYNDASGSVDIILTKAPTVTTVTINGGPFTYTGSAITPATVSVTGAGGLNLSPTAVYLNNTNAGTATASYDYAESVNHLSSSDSKTFEIGKANATIDVTGYSGVYDGSAHGATGTAEGVLGEALAGLDLGASFINVPGGTAD